MIKEKNNQSHQAFSNTRKTRNKSRIVSIVLIVCICVFSLYGLLLVLGTTTIFDFIEKVESKAHRQLEVGIDETDGYYYIKNNNDEQPIRILQLTDIHLTASVISTNRDRWALEAVIQLIEKNKPDLIILTGDTLYSTLLKGMSINNYNTSRAIVTFFEKIGIPWALVYGNHDAEIYSLLNKSKLSQYFSSLESCLFQEGPKDISGQGNYIIKILNSNAELVSACVLMDSNSYVGLMDYDNIHDDQVNWYKKEVSKLKDKNNNLVPTHLFIHIPFNEYLDAWNAYQAGSEEAIYHFGKIGNEGFSIPKYRGKIFEAIKEIGSTKAVYCGHDHTMNFSITYQGVRLTYGMSIDYIAYVMIFNKTEQRGGTVIDISTVDGSFEIYQAPQNNNFEIVK